MFSSLVLTVLDGAIVQMWMSVPVGLLSVMRMQCVLILTVVSSATVRLDTLEAVTLETAMVCLVNQLNDIKVVD